MTGADPGAGGIKFHGGIMDIERIEELFLGECSYSRWAAADDLADQAIEDQGVARIISEFLAGRLHCWLGGHEDGHIAGAIKHDRGGIAAGAVFFREQAGLHSEQIIGRDSSARVVGVVPFGDWGWFIDINAILAHQDREQGVGEGFRD